MDAFYTQCMSCGRVRLHENETIETSTSNTGTFIDKKEVAKDARVYAALCRHCVDKHGSVISESECIVSRQPEPERKPTITLEEFNKAIEECIDMPYEQLRPRLNGVLDRTNHQLRQQSEPFMRFVKLRRDEILSRVDEVTANLRREIDAKKKGVQA